MDEKTQTQYVVLQQQFSKEEIEKDRGSAAHWTLIGKAYANNDRAAIKQVSNGKGHYVAVPARSWHPRTREIEMTERDVWS